MTGENLVKRRFSGMHREWEGNLLAGESSRGFGGDPASTRTRDLLLRRPFQAFSSTSKKPNESDETRAHQGVEACFAGLTKSNQKQRFRRVPGEQLVNFSIRPIGLVPRSEAQGFGHHHTLSTQDNVQFQNLGGGHGEAFH